MLDGDPAAPTEISQQPHTPNFRPMSIVAKRSPISATAEHLLFLARVKWKSLHLLRRSRMTMSGQHSHRGVEYHTRLWRVFGYMSNIGVETHCSFPVHPSRHHSRLCRCRRMSLPAYRDPCLYTETDLLGKLYVQSERKHSHKSDTTIRFTYFSIVK